MKLKRLEELEDGMWCRLASGEVYTHDGQVYWRGIYVRSYVRALLDMGAEWYPPIPEGYRLATAEDRKGPKPLVYGCAGASHDDWDMYGGDKRWSEKLEYIVPIKPEPERSVGKVYTVYEVYRLDGPSPFRTLDLEKDFPIGAQVTVALAEDSAHGTEARQSERKGGKNR